MHNKNKCWGLLPLIQLDQHMSVCVLLISMIVINGCAYTSQVATLNPKVTTKKSNIGSGSIVELKVVDERLDKKLGHRGSAYGPAAEISTGQNVAELIYQKLAAGLENNGFFVVPFNNGVPTSFKAEIRQIKYHSAAGFVTFTIQVNSAIKGICRNNEKNYELMYRGEVEEEWLVVPFADTNERILNESLSKVLEKMFLDKKLLECLS